LQVFAAFYFAHAEHLTAIVHMNSSYSANPLIPSSQWCGLMPTTGITYWIDAFSALTLLVGQQEALSGSGISWAIYKSAPRPRQILVTMPAPYH